MSILFDRFYKILVKKPLFRMHSTCNYSLSFYKLPITLFSSLKFVTNINPKRSFKITLFIHASQKSTYVRSMEKKKHYINMIHINGRISQ